MSTNKKRKRDADVPMKTYRRMELQTKLMKADAEEWKRKHYELQKRFIQLEKKLEKKQKDKKD